MRNPATVFFLSIIAVAGFAQTAGPSVTPGAPFQHEFQGPLDNRIWERMTYTFEGNGCVCDPSEAIASEGMLKLRIAKLEKPREGRKYSSGGLRSRRYFGYGTFTVRMRSPIPTGTVSSFFLMNEWKPGNWLHQEIDFEFLGKSRGVVQTNIHHYYADSGSAVGEPFVWDAPFDYGMDFHDYSIAWFPDRVEWKVDGLKIKEVKAKIPDEPLSILMNFWIPDPSVGWTANWVGPFDESSLPAFAEYLRVTYEPAAK